LRRCLEKDRQRRLPDVGVVRLEIDDARAAPAASRVRTRIPWPLIAAAISISLALGGIAGVWWSARGSQPVSNVSALLTRTVVELPASAPLALGTRIPAVGFDSPALAVSPDGSQLAYIAESPTGTLVYVRDLSGTTATPVPGTEGAIYAFFSPDGRSLGFLTNDRVKKVALDGTSPITLSTAMTPVNATWTDDAQIYVAEEEGRRLSRVGSSGGTPTVVRPTTSNVRFSQVLPGGRAALATVSKRSISSDYADIGLVSLASGEVTTLVESGYDARFVAPGHLVFGRAGALYVVGFDPDSGRMTGTAVPVASDVSMESLFAQAHVALSANGLLAYVPGGERALGRLVWIDREGRAEDVAAPTRVYGSVDLSPDDTRLVVHVADVTDYIWLYDFLRKEGRKLTAVGAAGWPLWHRDGKTVLSVSWQSRITEPAIVSQLADGGVQTELLPSSPERTRIYPIALSPDGQVLATSQTGRRTGGTFYSMTGAMSQLADAFGAQSSFSPDGRWVAYVQASGRNEVFIRSYPGGDVTRQFSVDGGVEAYWCPCGELFYRRGNQWMASRVSTTPELKWDPLGQVFQTDFLDTPGRSYDVSSDGKRLLVVKRAEPDIRDRIHVVTNWPALLGSR
jgi:Tol biopolymer transport system component